MKHGTCIHFTGLPFVGKEYKTACCKAGVNYFEAFNGRRDGIMLRMPCVEFVEKPAGRAGTRVRPGDKAVHVPVDRHGCEATPCAHRKEPTAEQVEQSRIEDEASFQRVLAAVKISAERRVKPKPTTDRGEAVECPCCGGRLHLFQSAYNGHVSGQCETEGCVKWME